MILLAIASAAAVTAQPTKLQTYKDWIVGCDNVRVCQANALEPADGGDDAYLDTTISRGALPSDRATLDLPLSVGKAKAARYSLKVDGVTVVTFDVTTKADVSLPLTGGLLAPLRKGGRAMVFDAGGRSQGGLSLAGLAAALRYMDDQQGRAGTVGALVATGAKPDSAVPKPPAYPVITRPAASSNSPRNISVAVATQLIGADDATCDDAVGKVNPRAYRLDSTHSLVLIDHPCGNGAYNYFTSVYVLDETGPARPARFDLAPGMGEPSTDGTGDLTNGDWDPKSRQLGSYEKGRGLGDCGTTERYAWDGARFRLIEQAEMGECRGAVNFIRTWIARTSR